MHVRPGPCSGAQVRRASAPAVDLRDPFPPGPPAPEAVDVAHDGLVDGAVTELGEAIHGVQHRGVIRAPAKAGLPDQHPQPQVGQVTGVMSR